MALSGSRRRRSAISDLPYRAAQIGINLVRFGSRGTTVPINGFGIDRIDWVSCFKEPANQEAVIGFNNARYFLFVGACDGKQKLFQVFKSLRAMGDAQRSNLFADISNDADIMVLICPIQTDKPHDQVPPC